MDKKISIKKGKEADETLGESRIREYDLPTHEIDLPRIILKELDVQEGDTIAFVKENDRIYIKKI